MMTDTDQTANSRQSGVEPQFLGDPEVTAALERMLEEFATEKDRGATLIAAEIVSDHLAKLISELAPSTFKRNDLKAMFGAHGTLGTFAAKADIAHLAGFIGGTAYQAIGKLRRLRNKAAHPDGPFSLKAHHDTVHAICDLGPGMMTSINRFALETMTTFFFQRLMGKGVELESTLGRNPFSSRQEVIDHLAQRPDLVAAWEDQLPRMELALATWLLIGLIQHQKRQTLARRTPSEVAQTADT
jgi:hypothetical protein